MHFIPLSPLYFNIFATWNEVLEFAYYVVIDFDWQYFYQEDFFKKKIPVIEASWKWELLK